MTENKKGDDRLNAIAIGGIAVAFVMAAVLTPLAQGQNNYSSPSDNPSSSMPSSSSSMMPPIVNPTNVQTDTEPTLNVFQGNPNDISIGSPVLNGIAMIAGASFPSDTALSGPVTGISVRYKHGTVYHVINDYLVDLEKGEVFVSVKSPSKLAMVKTPFGEVAVAANGDVLVSFENGVMRVMNLDGAGHQVIKINLNQGPFGGPADPTVTINAGYELIAGDRQLTRADLRPRDGVARRKFKLLENGHMAVSEISVESVLKANDVIADIRQNATGVKERRIMGDLSKMAAILNYKNGTQGFSVDEKN